MNRGGEGRGGKGRGVCVCENSRKNRYKFNAVITMLNIISIEITLVNSI